MRKATYPIQEIILHRSSPRAMTAESIPDEELFALFEAARWAPSSYNAQPWRFLYAKREGKYWDLFFSLLIEFNQNWCKHAAALGVIVSRSKFEKTEKPARTFAFDAGAAWENLAIEGSSRGLVVHGMQGFNYEKAKELLKVPDPFEVMAMFAVGKKGAKETLPPDLQEKEILSDRKPLHAIAAEGLFQFGA